MVGFVSGFLRLSLAFRSGAATRQATDQRGEGSDKRRKVAPCPVTRYASKVGVGVLGIELSEAQSVLGGLYQKLLGRTCRFCQGKLLEPDPVHPTRSRTAWLEGDFLLRVFATSLRSRLALVLRFLCAVRRTYVDASWSKADRADPLEIQPPGRM